MWFQNNFLENRFELKIFWSTFFYFWNRFEQKFFIKNFLVRKFLWLQDHFFENRFEPKIFIKKFLVENFLWLQNHFLENRFDPKIVTKNFLVETFFYGLKIISSKIGYYQTFSTKCFGRKFFMVTKSFPRKQIHTITFQQNFWSKIFYGCNIISSRTGSYQKFL